MKCVNVHVCQSCFLTDRQTRKHKTHHPVLEFCKQVRTHVTGSTGNRTGIKKLREQNRYQGAQVRTHLTVQVRGTGDRRQR